MRNIKAVAHIWHDGEKFKPGQVIPSMNEEVAKQLVKDRAAFFVDETPFSIKDENQDSSKTTSSLDDSEDDFKVLDEAYTLDELKETAAGVDGVDFKGTISKKDLITLIIESGKIDEFFEETE
ncbi:hypothetical protein [Peribacillus aracenensis]|uniref:hypothetical protein n=1 Tax=Peribacillus aracenensis TaxID=2976708 RepID=UPI0021A6DDAD|nr:hypothetical protein [Peribacillus sp. BBB004]